jgi:hypothetical protein
MSEDADRRRRDEGPDDADQPDGAGGGAEPRPAYVHTAVEQDDDERDGHDPLDRSVRHVPHRRHEVRGDRRAGEEDGRRRDAQPLAQPVGQDGEQADECDAEDDPAERHRVGDGAGPDGRRDCWRHERSSGGRGRQTWCRPDFPARRVPG